LFTGIMVVNAVLFLLIARHLPEKRYVGVEETA
jgi:hypothetical protein